MIAEVFLDSNILPYVCSAASADAEKIQKISVTAEATMESVCSIPLSILSIESKSGRVAPPLRGQCCLISSEVRSIVRHSVGISKAAKELPTGNWILKNWLGKIF